MAKPPNQRWRAMRDWRLMVVIPAGIVFGIMLGCGNSNEEPTESATAEIRTATVRTGSIEKTIRLTGVTAPKNQVSLIAPRLRGRRGRGRFTLTLQEIVPSGSRVKKGDIVAQFDSQYMETQMDDYEDTVIRQQASIASSKASLDVTRKAHQQQILSAKGQVDKSELDLKTVPVRSAIETELFRLAQEEAEASHKQLLEETKYVNISEGAELRIAELDLKEAQLELSRANNNMEKMVVRSPVDGLTVVLDTNRGTERDQIRKGDDLRPGMPYLTIVDLDSMMVDADVSQVDSEQIRIGAPATVHFDAYQDLVLPASVYSVGTIARSSGFAASNFVRNIPVRLSLEGTDPRIIPNFTVSADVLLDSEEDATIVPLGCVFSDEETQAPIAFVKQGNGWERRDLELGLANNLEVAVRAGLKAGEVVAAEWPETAKNTTD